MYDLRGDFGADPAAVREPFAFPGGRRFQFTDPSGNELGVWSQAGGAH